MQRIYLLTFLFFSCLVFETRATVITANCTGDWCNSSTWSPNRIPQCGDTIVIPAGYKVTITTMENYFSCGQVIVIDIYGELSFQTGKKLVLPCNSVVKVNSGGKVSGGSGGGNSDYIEICNQIVWNAGSGTLYGPVELTAGSPLPVELISFTAVAEDRLVLTRWTTASEQNSSHFIVERSADGNKFETAAIVLAAGNSYFTINYSFTDSDPLAGLSYYRLKQVDTDGSTKMYQTVSVNTSTNFEIYPNPSDGNFTLIMNSKNKNEDFSIINSQGKEVFNFNCNEVISQKNFVLEPGLYIIQNANKKLQKRIIIR